MPFTAFDIFDLFVEPPGDLLFFLLVIGLSQAALFLAVGHRSRYPEELSTRRYFVASAALVGVWIVMTAAALLVVVSGIERGLILPPLERLAQTLSLVVLSWSFLSAEGITWRKRSDAAAAILLVLVLVIYGYTAYEWYLTFDRSIGFNASPYASIWSSLAVAIAFLGFLIALGKIRSIIDAPVKCLFLLLIIVGNGWDLWQFSQGSVAGEYLGAARLAYLAAMVLVPLIIYRLSIALLENSLAEVTLVTSQPSSSVREGADVAGEPERAGPEQVRESPPSFSPAAAAADTEPDHLLRALGTMMDSRENASIPEQVVRAAIDMLDIEVCVILRIQDMKYADAIAGIDHVTGQRLSGVSLNLEDQPSIVDAIRRRGQVMLYSEYHAEEINDLFRRMNIGATGNVYIQPILRREETVAVLLASMPYRQGELSPAQIESLSEIATMAGHILAWSFDAEAATFLAQELAIRSIIEGETADDVDKAEVARARREIEASLEHTAERGARMQIQIADLRLQLHEERIRVLDLMSESPEGIGVSQQVTVLFDEQSQLQEACDQQAMELLNAETVLRILSVESDDALAKIIGEYLQKAYNLQLDSRDRLRRQINNIRLQVASVAGDDPDDVVKKVSDESAQLELEKSELQKRASSILSKLQTLGIDTELSSMTQILIQLYAERKALKHHAAAMQSERDVLIEERAKWSEVGGEASDQLRKQLKHLSVDHETLLNLREEMRRDYQDLLKKYEASGGERTELVRQIRESRQKIAASNEEQSRLNQRIEDLSDERDNLLRIRDQLTARVAESMTETSVGPEAIALRTKLMELQNAVAQLTEQREQLALDLSDAHEELASARGMQPVPGGERISDVDGLSTDHRPPMMDLVHDLQGPMSAIAECTDILLGESIGILGAAQHSVLQRVSENIGRLTEMLDELSQLSAVSGEGFVLQYAEADMVALLEEAITSASSTVREKNLMLELSVEDNIPRISADAAVIRQILVLLVNNACLVSATGSRILVTVETGSIQPPETQVATEAIQTSISDTGGGIPAQDILRVFARRYMRENPKIDGLSDTGVGMTVARAFARAHKGDLWIVSEPGKGSTFHLALPVRLLPTVEE